MSVGDCPWRLGVVPDHLKEMCNEIMRTRAIVFFIVFERFKTQKMCIKAVEAYPWLLELVPDYFKTQGICDKTVRDDSSSLWFVPDWFVRQQQIKIWHDDDYYCNNGKLI